MKGQLIKKKVLYAKKKPNIPEADGDREAKVVSDLRSETKGSRFESGCQLCAEVELSAVVARLMSKRL